MPAERGRLEADRSRRARSASAVVDEVRQVSMVSKRQDGSPSHGRGGWKAARDCAVLLLTGLVVLSWLSLLTYSPADPPSHAVYPPPKPANAAGIVGAYLAHELRYWLGGGVYMGLAFASVAAFILVLGGRISALAWRAVGVVVLVAAASTAVHLLKPAPPNGVTVGPAGVLGAAVGRFLLSRFAQAGAWVIVIVSLCVGLLLAAENLVLQIPRFGRKVWDQRGQLPAMVGAIRSAIPTGQAEAPPARDRVPAPVKSAPKLVPPPLRPPAPPKPQVPPVTRATPKPPAPAAKPTPGKIARGQDGKEYVLPSPDLLAEPTANYLEMQESRAAENRAVLQQTLNDFAVGAEVVGHMTGPVITMFELTLAPGVKVSQVSNLAADIARAMAVPGVRVVSPLPGKDTIGIEVPNLQKEIVRIRELMSAAPRRREDDAPAAVPGQGRQWLGHRGGPGVDAAHADCRHHRLGQERVHQLDPHGHADDPHARAGAADPHRPQDGRDGRL